MRGKYISSFGHSVSKIVKPSAPSAEEKEEGEREREREGGRRERERDSIMVFLFNSSANHSKFRVQV
jgi:hypothetical protein